MTNRCPSAPATTRALSLRRALIRLRALAGAAFLAASASSHAQTLYVGSGNGTVSTYDALTSTTSNPSFITGVNLPAALAGSGNTLYVAATNGNTVGTYDATTGASLNASFLTGQSHPSGLVVVGDTLYVTEYTGNAISAYDATTGALINASFATLSGPSQLTLAGGNLLVDYNGGLASIALSTGVVNASFISTPDAQEGGVAVVGNKLFASNLNNGTVNEYDATTGALVQANYATGFGYPNDLAASGTTLFVADASNDVVTEYDTTTGLALPTSIAVSSPYGLYAGVVPEPSTWATLGLGAALLGLSLRRRFRLA